MTPRVATDFPPRRPFASRHPCGISPDTTAFCEVLDGDLKFRIYYYWIDLDPELLKIAKEWVALLGVGKLG